MYGLWPLTDKKGITINNAFQKILNKSERYRNKIWVDKGSKFYKQINEIMVTR